MKALLKKQLKTISKRISLLIAIFIMVVPFTLKAQPEEYRSDQGFLVGTSDSRLFITIKESDDHAEFQIGALGELSARAIIFSLVFDTTKLILTDNTLLYDIPDGAGISEFGAEVIYFSEEFFTKYSTFEVLPGRQRAILEGDGSGMKYFITEIFSASLTAPLIYLAPGEMIHVYSIFFRKVTPGLPITESDFGYFAQPPRPYNYPQIAPTWMNHALNIRFAPTSPATFQLIKPELFAYRSNSFVTTEETTQIQATSAILNATFTRGNLQPSQEIIVSEYMDAYFTGELKWDDITQYGFIYSQEDATILVKGGFSKKLNIDGTDYDFPDATELAAGEFVRNSKTFFIQHIFDNNDTDQSVPYSQTITGLETLKTYYAWSFIHYTFETSDPYLFVGDKIMFETNTLLDCEPLADQSVVICQLESYTHSGTSWDGVPAEGVTLSSLTYRLDGATTGTGTTLNNVNFNVGTTTVTWIGINNSGAIDSCKFEVEVIQKIVSPPIVTQSEQFFCSQALISDLAVSGFGITWYDSETATIPLNVSTPLIHGHTYYVANKDDECESERIAVQVFIFENVNPPVVESPVRFCTNGNDEFTLSDVQPMTGQNIKWYASETSEEVLPITTILENGATYWVSQTLGGCESSRSYVTIIFDNEMEIPAPQLISPQEFCVIGGNTLNDLISGGYNLVWYMNAEGGNPLNPNFPLVNGNTYYASQTVGNCESTERTPVYVVLRNVIQIEIEIDPQFFCEGAILKDIITPYNNLTWYATATSNKPLPWYTKLETGTYYAAINVSECESAARTEVPVTIGTSTVVITNPEQIFCGNATIADLYVMGQGVKWYSSEVSENPLPLETPLEDGATYYAENSNNSCQGERTAVNVRIYPFANPPHFVENAITEICEGEIIDVNFLLNLIQMENDVNYAFYEDENCTIPFTSYIVTDYATATNHTFYAMAYYAEKQCSHDVGQALEMVITVNPMVAMPLVIVSENLSVCEGETIHVAWLENFITYDNTEISLAFYSDEECTTWFTDIITDYTVAQSHTIFVVATNLMTGCVSQITDTLTITIIVNELPEIPTITNDAILAVCDETVINLELLQDFVNYNSTLVTLEFFMDEDCTIPFTNITANYGTATSHTFFVRAKSKETGCITHLKDVLTFTVYVDQTPEVYAQNLIYCSGEEVPEYTFEGTDNTTFFWERIVGYDFGLDVTEGVNTIPAFVAHNFGFEYLTASYKVTPVSEHGCVGETKLFLITVNPKPVTTPVEDMVYCNATTAPRFDFTSNIPDAYYEWEFVNEMGSTVIPGVPESGENYIPSFETYHTGNQPLVGKYRVRASYTYSNLTCYDEEWQYFNIVILPTPEMPTVQPVVQTICSGEQTTPITFTGSVEEVTYIWSLNSGDILPGFPTNGEGNIPSYMIENNQMFSLSATYEVKAVLNYNDYPAYTCESSTAVFGIIVNPTTQTDPVPDFVYCNGEVAPTYYFTGNNPLATHYWEYVSGDILPGIAQNGMNSFPYFMAVNNSNAPLVANYRVQASYGDFCPQLEWELFSVTVLPTPTVVATPEYQVINSGEMFDDIIFSGNVTNVIYQWTRIEGIIPELPASGEGNITGITLYNYNLTPIYATYSVVPKLNYADYPGYTCTGVPAQFTITVNPTVSTGTVTDFVYCNGETAPAYTFTGSNPLATYYWEFVSGADLGIPTSGNNSFPSFIAINTENTPIIANYQVRAVANGINSDWEYFSVTVLPTPSVDLNIEPYEFCANEETTAIDLVEVFATLNNMEETVYEWTYISSNDIGLSQTFGTNIIPSFVAINNSNQQITALISVKARLNHCYGEERIFKINVNPMPAVVSQTNAGIICSGDNFEYAILTSVPVNVISWERVSHPDINNNESANGNTDFISERLYNSGSSDVKVTYLITLATGSCEFVNIGEVFVVVKPDFDLNIDPITLACKGELTTSIKYQIDIPGIQYTLQFDPVATAEGWASVTNFVSLPESEISVNIPVGAKLGNYNAALTLRFGNCINTYNMVITLGAAPVITDAADTDIALCNGEDFYLFVEVEGNAQYQWYFENELIPNETDHFYEVAFDNSKEGIYAVAVSNQCGTIYHYFNVKINPAMIDMKWDDVMYVDNSQNMYVAYQWYKNGNPVAKEGQSQYYTEKGGFTPFAEYKVRAYKSDGSYDEACPFVPNDGTKGKPGFSIYPNPSLIGDNVTFLLHLPGEEEPDADVLIYDAGSKLVKQFRITNAKTEVMMNVASGTYFVKVTTKNGTEFIEKIIIHKP